MKNLIVALEKLENFMINFCDINFEQGVEYNENGEIVGIYDKELLKQDINSFRLTLEELAKNKIQESEYSVSRRILLELVRIQDIECLINEA